MPRIRTMTIDDHGANLALMKATPGVAVREADSHEATARYLARNPGLSFVAEADGEIVGSIMSGHDGRRGYLQHLLVHPAHRRQGLATALVQQCLNALQAQGILKSHIDVYADNQPGRTFWASQGWQWRTDTVRYSFIRGGNQNA